MARVTIDIGLASDLEVIDQFLEPKDQYLVDAGCGNMQLSKALADRGASVLAIDPDPIQADKNKRVQTMSRVAFAQCGAQEIPVESGSVDGVVFPYSLHHVPQSLYNSVFTEARRVLKPDGFVYVIEPVAQGDLNDVMRLFHDEQEVRHQAQIALDTLAAPFFETTTELHYKTAIQYSSWQEYADNYAAKSYNTGYTEADVRADKVRDRFYRLGEPTGFKFEVPKKVTWLQRQSGGRR